MGLFDRLRDVMPTGDVEYQCPSCGTVLETARDRCPECGEIDIRERGSRDYGSD